MATNLSQAEHHSPGAGAVEVAVLGSARIGPGDPRHDDAGRLGALLAAQGWTVVTGGYGGLMAAASRGASAAGGRTVGLPMRAWQHLTPDASCAELRWSVSYAERLAHLLAASVAIALPGGVGTLAEASAVWAAAQTEPGAAQLVLVGPAWRALMAAFADQLIVGPKDLALPVAVDTVDDVVPAVQRLLHTPAAVLGAHG
ncbi:MAG TPA: LOG family protein [Streptosporangiaceae bacterium]